MSHHSPDGASTRSECGLRGTLGHQFMGRGHVLRTSTFSITGGSTVDLNDNALIANASSANLVANNFTSGYANGAGSRVRKPTHRIRRFISCSVHEWLCRDGGRSLGHASILIIQ